MTMDAPVSSLKGGTSPEIALGAAWKRFCIKVGLQPDAVNTTAAIPSEKSLNWTAVIRLVHEILAGGGSRPAGRCVRRILGLAYVQPGRSQYEMLIEYSGVLARE